MLSSDLYRNALTLSAGIADVDTRAITRRLRDTGALNGIITTDMSTPAEELVQQTKSWSILGKDLISEVSLGCPCALTCIPCWFWKWHWLASPQVAVLNTSGCCMHLQHLLA